MPKENTHLWFAQSLIAASETETGLGLLREESLPFFLGSIIPDALYYHPHPRARRMPRVLHGSDPEWKDTTPVWLVAQTGRSGSPGSKAFVLGYLSHLALDKVFHPVVHVLSGKRSGQSSSAETTSRHRLVETALDRLVNQTCFFHRIIQPRIADHVQTLQALAAKAGLGSRDVRHALAIQHLANRLILGRGMHGILTFLDRLPFWNLSALRNLCYAQLDQEPSFVEDENTTGSGDSVSNKALRAVCRIRWVRLFARSKKDALAMFQSCEAYWQGDLDEEALALALPQKACD